MAALEGILIRVADPTTSTWILLQSILFWFSCGLVVSISNTGLPKWIGSILLTEILTAPWLIALVIIPEQYSHLVPLIVVNTLFGAVIGGLNKILKTPE
ncbi:hypothetical protein CH352_17140 [Leptospira hartskeerlii]|uniref:Uncharacterized protein n=2 Tax=Leptospira hartskeerlii TaxID=2023177 RepID=A0A2M9XDF1_9LEPT|nr:hypothetical protein CH357_11825 [Leptospira hartskeerlii]PJZ32247.1 hypothetical protein CH352_17140 [Leptospira hartskeerlii]